MVDPFRPRTLRPAPIDLTHHISRSARSRKSSDIKRFYKYFSIPGIGQLAGGLPNPDYFPYDDLEARVSLPNRWKPTPTKPVDPPSEQFRATHISDDTSTQLVVPKAANTLDKSQEIDLVTALQYGLAQGYPPLYNYLREFTRKKMHPNCPYQNGPEIILTCGSTDGFSKTLQLLNNEWIEGRDPIDEREGLLVEEYCYMNAIQTAQPRGMNIVPVAMDDEGMKATGEGGLDDVLENWDYSRGRLPHLMYTVTIGQNPTGTTLSVQRRKAIYKLCSQYDIIIVEDDPYWFLQYPSALSAERKPPKPEESSGYEFLDSLVPSYLSVDVEGRVVRLDTFSKTVAPGCRLGWITAQPAFIERILRITETSTQQPSGFVQSMIAELVIGPENKNDGGRGGAKDGSGWKMDGWVRWLEGLRGNYERRMTAMCDILDEGKTLVKSGRRNSLATSQTDDEWSVVETTQIYDFVRPMGGMFCWLRYDFSTHPLSKRVKLARLSRAMWEYLTREPFLVLVSPGSIFAATPQIQREDAWACFRLCFAACDEDKLAPISYNLVRGSQAFWRIKDPDTIDKLLEDIEGNDHEDTYGSNNDYPQRWRQGDFEMQLLCDLENAYGTY